MGYISLLHAKISSTNKNNSTILKNIVLTQPIHKFETIYRYVPFSINAILWLFQEKKEIYFSLNKQEYVKIKSASWQT